jgi:hypothetical protein
MKKILLTIIFLFSFWGISFPEDEPCKYPPESFSKIFFQFFFPSNVKCYDNFFQFYLAYNRHSYEYERYYVLVDRNKMDELKNNEFVLINTVLNDSKKYSDVNEFIKDYQDEPCAYRPYIIYQYSFINTNNMSDIMNHIETSEVLISPLTEGLSGELKFRIYSDNKKQIECFSYMTESDFSPKMEILVRNAILTLDDDIITMSDIYFKPTCFSDDTIYLFEGMGDYKEATFKFIYNKDNIVVVKKIKEIERYRVIYYLNGRKAEVIVPNANNVELDKFHERCIDLDVFRLVSGTADIVHSIIHGFDVIQKKENPY